MALLPAVLVVAAGFFGTNWIAHHSFSPPYMHRGGADNWYNYTYERNGRQVESYWKHPPGRRRGEPSPRVYALHVLVGHHGIFSLDAHLAAERRRARWPGCFSGATGDCASWHY